MNLQKKIKHFTINDWQPTLCDNIKAKHHASSRIGCKISICTKGDTCARNKNNFKNLKGTLDFGFITPRNSLGL
jgi:hypothetical protein